MSLLTFSLYQFYWFYRHWQIEKQREHPRIMPVGRSLLVYFFCYPLFKRIAARGAAHRLTPLPAGWLALGWIVTSLMGELPPPYLLAVFLTGFFLLPVQRVANAVNTLRGPGPRPQRPLDRVECALDLRESCDGAARVARDPLAHRAAWPVSSFRAAPAAAAARTG